MYATQSIPAVHVKQRRRKKETEREREREKEQKSSSRLSMHRNYEKSSYSSYSFHIQQYPLAATSPAPFSEKNTKSIQPPPKHINQIDQPHTPQTPTSSQFKVPAPVCSQTMTMMHPRTEKKKKTKRRKKQ
jgi:hypothetical protein